MTIADRIIAHCESHPPDFIIGGKDNPYLLRWFLIPRNPICNAYAHCFKRSDDDRAHHTHPWLVNLSWLLRNEYTEHTIRIGGLIVRTIRRAGQWKIRFGPAPHRIELHNGDCWTLFITGPRVRSWGFICGERFVHWRIFTAPDDKGAIGKGCGA